MRSSLRMLGRYASFLLGRPRPAFVSYNVTYRCNLRCAFCTAVNTAYGELDEKGSLHVIEALADFGVPLLDFSGGEPLLRRDLDSLARRAKELGMITSMNSNGTLARDVSRVAKWLDFATISLDGPEEVHDYLRGRGVFRRALEGLRALRDGGVRAGVNIVILPDNISKLRDFIEWLRDEADYVTVQPVHPPRRVKGVSELIEYLIELKREEPNFIPLPTQYLRGIPGFLAGNFDKVCDAGKLYISISPKGEVLACGARNDLVLGNLFEEGLGRILSEDRIRGAVERCRGCWLECTVGVSMAFRRPEPLTYIKLLRGHPRSYSR